MIGEGRILKTSNRQASPEALPSPHRVPFPGNAILFAGREAGFWETRLENRSVECTDIC
jgi:hypothetical protein